MFYIVTSQYRHKDTRYTPGQCFLLTVVVTCREPDIELRSLHIGKSDSYPDPITGQVKFIGRWQITRGHVTT